MTRKDPYSSLDNFTLLPSGQYTTVTMAHDRIFLSPMRIVISSDDSLIAFISDSGQTIYVFNRSRREHVTIYPAGGAADFDILQTTSNLSPRMVTLFSGGH